jgi:regulator of protease activity HflC (stomatin/prohibitin superfamily)
MNVASVLQVLASLSWLVFIGVLVFAGIGVSRGRKVKGAVSIVLIVGALAIILTSVSAGLVFVQPDERGVVISALAPKGYREAGLEPGLRWIIPYFENVVFYPISRQTYTMSIASKEGQLEGDDSIAARTYDGQEVFVDASIIYSIDPAKVILLHIQWQGRYTTDLIRPLSRGIIRDIVSQYQIDQVYSTKRSEMTALISDELERKLAENGLVQYDFVLRNITFSPEYAASVEQKQIAEQQAQQAKFVVEQRKQEAEQARQVAQGKADSAVIQAQGDAKARLIQAEAESNALKLIADALKTSPDLLTYQYISNLAPGIQVMLLPNNNPFLLQLPTMTPRAPQESQIVITPEPTPLPSPTP